jgi:hypothetical protein
MNAREKRRAQQRRQQKKLEAELDALNRMVVIFEELQVLFKDLDTKKIIERAPRVTALAAEAERLVEKYNLKSKLPTHDEIFADLEHFRQVYNMKVATTAGVGRLVRIKVHQLERERADAAATTAQGTLCSNCGKKPAHFGTLCKRCADELGVRPTGKA